MKGIEKFEKSVCGKGVRQASQKILNPFGFKGLDLVFYLSSVKNLIPHHLNINCGSKSCCGSGGKTVLIIVVQSVTKGNNDSL